MDEPNKESEILYVSPTPGLLSPLHLAELESEYGSPEIGLNTDWVDDELFPLDD